MKLELVEPLRELFKDEVRAVGKVLGMTADWYHFAPEILAAASSRIANKVRGISRVVYDISSKPPATVEWE